LVTAVVLAERLRAQVSQSDFETVGRISVSIGVSQCLPEEEWPQWLDRADAALYRAKRNGRNQVQFAPETPLPEENFVRRPTHLVHLSWHEAYACGHDTIDHEHRLLFSMANGLLNAIFLGKSGEEISEIIGLLTVEVAAHFRDEEVILADIGYPGATEHAQLHKALLTKARRLANAFDEGTTEVGSIFQFLAYDVIATHMLKADREFFPSLKTGTGTRDHGSPTRH
jgi:hemerythrin-like metal-binding protein